MKPRNIWYIIIPVMINLIFCLQPATADSLLTKRRDVQKFIDYMTTKHKFTHQQLVNVINDVKLQPQIIVSMDKPYEQKNWDVYKQLFLTQQRLQEGLNFWRINKKLLDKAEQYYGVPASVIVAILGVETLYGKQQGNYRVIDSLATLAFNYPKRAHFFKKELAEYLLLCREHKINPNQYVGSYAGAMGKPQFMPSSYRYYAANFSNSPRKDLMNDDQAVIASVANYFHQHGWKMHQGIAQPAKISGNNFQKINTNYKLPAYNLQQLYAAGVEPLTAAIHKPQKVGVIALNTAQGKEYWLTYNNFYVITKYNSSPQYALVVYLLSKQLERQWLATVNHNNKFAYT